MTSGAWTSIALAAQSRRAVALVWSVGVVRSAEPGVRGAPAGAASSGSASTRVPSGDSRSATERITSSGTFIRAFC